MIPHVIEGASFGPDTLKVIGQAFDQAWADVDDAFPTPLAKKAARLFLANALLALATADSRDVGALRLYGMQALAVKYPRVVDSRGHAERISN